MSACHCKVDGFNDTHPTQHDLTPIQQHESRIVTLAQVVSMLDKHTNQLQPMPKTEHQSQPSEHNMGGLIGRCRCSRDSGPGGMLRRSSLERWCLWLLPLLLPPCSPGGASSCGWHGSSGGRPTWIHSNATINFTYRNDETRSRVFVAGRGCFGGL